ncbi:MAG TPA: hypothetical protein VK468_03720, partial [Pyrinomonadaceae bacterium]|nr:hypothetical protein [Pyrinomonadaceae bacterium]
MISLQSVIFQFPAGYYYDPGINSTNRQNFIFTAPSRNSGADIAFDGSGLSIRGIRRVRAKCNVRRRSMGKIQRRDHHIGYDKGHSSNCP